MPAALLTCPDALLCNIGIEADTGAPLGTLDGTVTQRGPYVVVELRDPVDAVLALRQLIDRGGVELTSFVASRAAIEMLSEDAEPIRSAWAWLRGLVAHPRAGLVGIVRHFTDLYAYPLPDALAEQELPAGHVVLWSAFDGRMIAIDHDDFTVGRVPPADFLITDATVSRRHVAFERAPGGWRVRDTGSTSGFFVNDYRGGASRLLLPGMVVQFARPWALVVIAVR